jgi:hypothetical protein
MRRENPLHLALSGKLIWRSAIPSPGGEHCNFVYLLVDKADVPESAVLSFDTYRIVPYSPKDPLPALEEILKAEKISRS